MLLFIVRPPTPTAHRADTELSSINVERTDQRGPNLHMSSLFPVLRADVSTQVLEEQGNFRAQTAGGSAYLTVTIRTASGTMCLQRDANVGPLLKTTVKPLGCQRILIQINSKLKNGPRTPGCNDSITLSWWPF